MIIKLTLKRKLDLLKEILSLWGGEGSFHFDDGLHGHPSDAPRMVSQVAKESVEGSPGLLSQDRPVPASAGLCRDRPEMTPAWAQVDAGLR